MARRPDERLAPIFMIADEYRDPCYQMIESLPPDWYYVPIHNPNSVRKYSLQFAPTGIFLADDVSFRQGGAARLLQVLLDDVGAPVIVLTEECTPEVRERWMRMGAADCIAHPMRWENRRRGMIETMNQLARGPLRSPVPGLKKEEGGATA